ncbi:MAG: TldD/PmbA family protein [Candidatus Faecivicinus sp.]
MDRKQFIDALFARAKEAGFEACEVYFAAADSFNTDVFKGEIVKYSDAGTLGLGFRGLIGGKMGYASTQILDEDAIDLLVDGAKTNAELIENDDRQFLHPGDAHYAEPVTFNPALDEISNADKIAMARELERLTLSLDPRVQQVDGCQIVSENAEVSIVNTLGLNVTRRSNMIGGYVVPAARDGEKVSSGFAYFFTLDPKRIDLAATAKEAVGRALDALDAEPVESGSMRVLLTAEAAADLLDTFAGVFSADAAQKGLSLLKGREGETVAAPCVTLLDDPHRPGSPASTPFDGEGVATRVKRVIDGGTLTTLLHNLKTAHKQGVETTANASRGYSSTVGIAPTNFYFAPSDIPFEGMLEKLGDGLAITEIAGMHAGANAISGDFSLSAKGFRVRGGIRGESVRQITVAGNFYQLLRDIEAVGGDLKFGLPSASLFGSPSLLISSLSIAGK